MFTVRAWTLTGTVCVSARAASNGAQQQQGVGGAGPQ